MGDHPRGSEGAFILKDFAFAINYHSLVHTRRLAAETLVMAERVEWLA
jgi:hypothetical protein